jgi:acyl-CoA synthetase (AMP-forming)/AMP-acid ligase II/thioesterase domain-containing protein/acyl carrier protein
MATVTSADTPTGVSRGLSIRELLETQAERRPDALAVIAPDRPSLSYGRLWEHTTDVVKTLNSLGLGRGDRVAIVLPNGPELAVAFLAVSTAVTCAPLNPAYRAEEFDFYLSDLNARALIIQSGADSPAIAVAQSRGIPVLELSPVLKGASGIFTLRPDKHSRVTSLNGHTLVPGFAHHDDVALVLHTSGTTSRPKIVPLTQTNICTTARNMQVAFELTEEDRGLTVMPLFHIHGLIGATLTPLAAGASIVCTPGFDVTRFFVWMDAFHPTWYTAVPTMHQALLTRADANRSTIGRCPLRFIRSCSAALPPQVMMELERVFQAPVTESYGMTEASHHISGNPLPPRKRKPGSVGVSTGPEIATMDDVGNLLPSGQKGEIVIRGANVTQGYENNPTANKATYTNGWFRTGDQGFLDADGYLFITGRLKEIINRGGEKVSPREVDEVLMDHPSVAQVATFAAPHVSLGEEVAAAVVLRENASVTEREIQEFASLRLADFKIPRRVIFLKELPKGPTGKLQRIGLAEKLGLTATLSTHPESQGPFTAPRDTLESQLTEIWERVLAMKPVGIKDNFFDLGGNSLLAVSLIIEIEKTIGRNLPPSFLLQAPTVERLADMLRKGDGALLSSPLVAIQPDGSNPPFFFIHAVSGNILHYRHLSRHLGSDQPFYGFQAQGLDGKLPPLRRIEGMAAFYVKEIRSVQRQGPYFLGGGSSGGIVAFEMAQQLRAQDQEVAVLALFDTYFPGRRVNTFAQRVDRHLGSLLLRRPKEQISYLFGMFGARVGKSVQGLTQRLRPDGEGPMARSMREVLEANREAVTNYVPQVYPGRIVLLLSSEAPDRFFYDARLGWTDMAAGGLEVHVVPGDHETLFSEPHVRAMAEKLRACLQRVPLYSLLS